MQEQLADWKKKRHMTVLQVEGPRQVIYVNLVRDGFMEQYCKKAGIVAFTDDDNTVLVIDEIQESTVVYNMIRDLRERLSCDIIVSGSYYISIKERVPESLLGRYALWNHGLKP